MKVTKYPKIEHISSFYNIGIPILIIMKNQYDDSDHKLFMYYVNLIQTTEQKVANYIGLPLSKISYAEMLLLSRRLVTYYELQELTTLKNIEKCKKPKQ